jgi:hypothetical protein
MTTPEQQFKRELEIFRTEAGAASQCLFSYLAVHAVASNRRDIHRLLNTAALFWNTALHALQLSAHIVRGRIFDQNSPHNVDKVLSIAQKNPEIFSKEALGLRKQALSSNASEWLDDYLKTAYEPTIADFRHLRSHVAKRRKIYDAKYRDIRRKFYAHKEAAERAEVDALFSKTKVQEIQRLFAFLLSLHDSLWELFYNGRKPVLRPVRYSVKRIRDLPSPQGGRNSVQETIIHEIEKFLLKAARKSDDSE